jgi:hypothetical protein
MKSKKTILSLNLGMLIPFFGFLYCTPPNTPGKTTIYHVSSYRTPIKIIEIDSCEYLFGEWTNQQF